METAKTSAAQLREQITKAEAELKALKERLAQVEEEEDYNVTEDVDVVNGAAAAAAWKWPLSAAEYDRYGRQLILPNIGIHGQKRLRASKVLIIGAGGLGCPAAAYIVGAGVGTLGIVDGDVVEPSNLHRQIAHATSRVGMYKVDSLVAYCRELNPLPKYVPYREHLTPQNAEDVVRDYDLVLDCTDHPTSRYLISDACVLLRKPLVSASALRTDGQLIVLNCPPTAQGALTLATATATTTATTTTATDARASVPPPCYRCIFPRPPPPEGVVSCGEGGVLGPVVGVMGVLQALEAVKVIAAGWHAPQQQQQQQQQQPPADCCSPGPTLLLFSGGGAIGAPTFRSVRMRGRRRDCFACGEGSGARLTLGTLRSGSLDYVAFCGGVSAPVEELLGEDQRMSVLEYHELLEKERAGDKGQLKKKKKKHVLLDVREKELFDICSLDGAVNIPYSKIRSVEGKKTRGLHQVDGAAAEDQAPLPEWIPPDLPNDSPIYVVCRVGNDSQLVAKLLQDLGLGRNGDRFIGDIKGGMRAWRDKIDSTLPFM